MNHVSNSKMNRAQDEAHWKRMPDQLVDWVIQYEELKQERRSLTLRDPLEQRDALEDRIDALVEKIQITGLTAAFFGGFKGMTELHDAAEAVVGRDNSVGATLNRLWDGIGGWWS